MRNRIGLKYWLIGVLAAFFLVSCTTTKRSFGTEEKISPDKLQSDYKLFRSVLEESHPSLYWFISKDSLDYYFDEVKNSLDEPLTEREFRTRLTYIVSKIRCGHTSIRYSSKYARFLDTANLKMFPLRLKFWSDTAVVTGNLNLQDTILRRGTVIKRVNGQTIAKLRDTFFNYLTGDGYSVTGRYQSLSNTGNFGILYRNLFGLTDTFNIDYVDSTGFEKQVKVPVFDPVKDSLFRLITEPSGSRKSRRSEEKFAARHLEIDTAMNSGFMTLNTFARGNKLKRFFRRSFRALRQRDIGHLVIDVRGNGGGDAGNSTLITQYIAKKPFKIADSLYAIKRSSQYSSHIQWQPIYWLMMQFVTHKKSDGKYHFGYFERHYFKPKKNNHYEGQVYILTGGNSFSATTLFAQTLKGQSNVLIVGEETGGGAYGNTAWMIPEVKLPKTGIRFRLPKFRLVMDQSLVKAGRGVMPDIQVAPTAEDIRRGIDVKTEAAKSLIISQTNKAVAVKRKQ